MTNITVVGGSGLLGSVIIPALSASCYKIVRLGRSPESDVHSEATSFLSINSALNIINPEIVINLSGLTNVDYCETHPSESYLVNTKIPYNLMHWIKLRGVDTHLIQISTDQLYDGNGPHSEEAVMPSNYYAFSKYAGELATLGGACSVIRTNFFGRSSCPGRESFTDWLFRSLSDRIKIQVFDDVLFSSLSMSTLSKMIRLVIAKKPIGVFNLGSRGGMSKADFAFAFAEELHLPTHNMRRTTTDQATFLKTYRPKDMRMDCTKFEETFQKQLPNLADEIKVVAKEYYDGT